MKRKLFGLMTLFLTVGALTGFAANEKKAETKCDKQECQAQQCDKQKCDKQRCDNQKCDNLKPNRKCFNPFEGITLSADQQAKLEALKAERPGRRCSEAKDCNNANNDAVKCAKADKKDNREARADRRQCKRDYLAKVKEILTPDQYVVFLENQIINRPDMRADRGPRHGSDHRGHKGQPRPNGRPGK